VICDFQGNFSPPFSCPTEAGSLALQVSLLYHGARPSERAEKFPSSRYHDPKPIPNPQKLLILTQVIQGGVKEKFGETDLYKRKGGVS
jgi:hypothetical protein